jgi:GntR family transcriptional regulator
VYAAKRISGRYRSSVAAASHSTWSASRKCISYGIHGIFEDQGHVMTRIREEASARMPHPEERRELRLPPGVPVLDVLHTSLDQEGQPYELTRFVMRADLTGLLYDVPVE